MNRFNNPLDHVRIAAPCKADWQQMIGTDRVRFCAQCNLNVYNLSSMTKAQAESLISQTEGRLCVRFYRRTDGSILTDNCPVGLRAIRRRLSYLAKGASAAVLSFFAGLGVYRTLAAPPTDPVMGVIAVTPAPLTTQQMGIKFETLGELAVTKGIEQGEVALPFVVETGRLSPEPLQSLVERKARRRTGRSRTESTR